MSHEFKKYSASVSSLIHFEMNPQSTWERFRNWFNTDGSGEFEQALLKETGIKLKASNTSDASNSLVSAAIPKTLRDWEKKYQSNAFYRAHAQLFLDEIKYIISRVPSDITEPVAKSSVKEVLQFVRPLLLDSILLFNDWGQHQAGVPGVFKISKNLTEHMMSFYQGARQTIYGHGTFGLSFIDNHSDLAIATIRQAVEIQLRRAFGIIGKMRKSDEAFYPIPLMDLTGC